MADDAAGRGDCCASENRKAPPPAACCPPLANPLIALTALPHVAQALVHVQREVLAGDVIQERRVRRARQRGALSFGEVACQFANAARARNCSQASLQQARAATNDPGRVEQRFCITLPSTNLYGGREAERDALHDERIIAPPVREAIVDYGPRCHAVSILEGLDASSR